MSGGADARLPDSREPAAGDIITLPSGGPDLTVLRVYSDVDRVVDFCWFTATGEYRTGTLPLKVLRGRRATPHPGILRDNPVLAAALHGALIEHGIPVRAGLDAGGIDRLLGDLVAAAIGGPDDPEPRNAAAAYQHGLAGLHTTPVR